jgi:predicted Zn-dependent protease
VVTLLRESEANAYCLPGGKIVVYTGILPVTGSDAALATVLGHEVAHATAEHSAERIEREHLTKVAAAIIAGERPASDRANRELAASGRARVQARAVELTRTSRLGGDDAEIVGADPD